MISHFFTAPSCADAELEVRRAGLSNASAWRKKWKIFQNFNHVFGLLRSVKNRTASMEENIFPDRYCGTHSGYALLMMALRIIVNLFLAIIINMAAAFLVFSHPVFFS